MKCPHCRIEVHEGFDSIALPPQGGGGLGRGRKSRHWNIDYMVCPACEQGIIRLSGYELRNGRLALVPFHFIYPKSHLRQPAPLEVPSQLAEDFNEAGLVLADSPKASAALSRRCLQALLRDQGFNQKDLAPAIEAVINSKQLPSALASNLDAIRNIGNFAAHPMKDTNTGSILPVEDHEAEWNLEVLEGLFDFYYVQPAKDAARRAALNTKLAQANKPAMKA